MNSKYASGQLAKAFVTALAHEDSATRRRAEQRIRRWESVISGMEDGSLDIGSRTPVKGLPAWVTPEVVRGGFATGNAAAGGPLADDERQLARRLGLDDRNRRELFDHHLTDAGLRELHSRLDSGRYDIVQPEEAALLVVAWLLRAGDRNGALDVLEAIGPFAGRLRFLPRPGKAPTDSSLVCRETVGEVTERLKAKRSNIDVARMNEAVSVWNPFADELLGHWLRTVRNGRVLAEIPEGWREDGAELLARYSTLARKHELCGKHRRPRENIAILRTSLEKVLAGRPPSRLLQRSVDAMVAKRGTPGSAEHAALREGQAALAARPTHHALAQAVAARLDDLPQDAGVPSVDAFVAPVIDGDVRTEIPESVRRIVENCLEASVGTLVERGVIPSAEVLAQLVPQLVASTTALSYPDPALRGLMAAVYRAFRNRRSLLLLNLEHQVRMSELPWVKAVGKHRRRADRAATQNARATLVQLGELTLRGFPGSIVPNPMVAEFDALARRAELRVPFVEELAADIFMGTFTSKFLDAAQLAGDLLEDSLYDRYYGIDYAAVLRLGKGFDRLCRQRTKDVRGWSVAANGTVIEQAQILTTHNLAALVDPIGVDPADGWDGLARRAFGVTCRLVRRVQGNPRPLRTVKDAAYAWRQTVFFLALCGLKEQFAVVAWMQDELDRQPAPTVRRLDPVLAGLRHVLAGGDLDDPNPHRRRFLGWTLGKHWMTT
ncbi:transcriptional regulator [Actinomadura spongiicola]|uniref:transcriptional regulator n=1 Tax=Actinomadura spongiicola TaxID=2303421 RepID=UPI001F195B5C|nr:transcriptional regulator [Actinomadura spongiicola]